MNIFYNISEKTGGFLSDPFVAYKPGNPDVFRGGHEKGVLRSFYPENENREKRMINSIVGETTRLSGDFEIDGVLRIDGVFQGSIKGNTQVLIGEKGKAVLNLEANEIVIGGQVEGTIKVKGKVKMLSTGYLKGEVTARKIEIEPGAYFSGKCRMLGQS